MGLGIVLIFWAIVGTVMATFGAIVFAVSTTLFTRDVKNGRWGLVVAAGLFPFVCLGWAGALFVGQALVNEGLLGRDLGIGDTWHAPLSRGYQVVMIDVTDEGSIYSPEAYSGFGSMEAAVHGVRRLQVTGPYIVGSASGDLGSEPAIAARSYFVIDTRTGNTTLFESESTFRAELLRIGVKENLQPIFDVYSYHRFSWFDVFVGVLFLLPPIGGVLFLIRRVIHLRRTR